MKKLLEEEIQNSMLGIENACKIRVEIGLDQSQGLLSKDLPSEFCLNDLNYIIKQLQGKALIDSTHNISGLDFYKSKSKNIEITIKNKNENHNIVIRKTISHHTVLKKKVASNGKNYIVYYKKNHPPKAMVLSLGGSDGGLNFTDLCSQYLANYGYISVAVPYFGYKDLPKSIERIPLEYFKGIWDDVRRRFNTKNIPIVLLGRSRGAELALILGSRYSDIDGVVAYSPSNVPWSIHDSKDSSWRYKEKDIPCVPHNKDVFQQLIANQNANRGISLNSCYIESKNLVNESELEIEVENIKGPIMLIDGKEDLLWPSTDSSKKIISRLNHNSHNYENIHLSYDNVGHCFDLPGIPLFKDDFSFNYGKYKYLLGGDEESTINAEYDSWNKIILFIDKISKTQI